MSGRKAFITVLISLLVIAILVAAGVMLYRMGFARGLAATGGIPAAGQFMHPYGFGMQRFGGGCPQAWHHGGGMSYGGHRPFGMFGFGSFGGWFICLLVLVGVVALVVAAVNGLTRRRPAEVQAVVAPPAPPAPQPTPAKPARSAGRARTSKR